MTEFDFLHGSSLRGLPPGLDKAARQFVVAPIPEALVAKIDVYGFEIPATREAVSADELHTDCQCDGDREQGRQDARPIDRPVQLEREENREEWNHVGPVSRAEAVPSPPGGILGKQQEVGDQCHEPPDDQAMGGKPGRDQRRGGQRQGDPGGVSQVLPA